MKAFEQIENHIQSKRSFVLEAGAGSGKTYTLIQTLNHLIQNEGNIIKYNNQKIICITYTNVAKNEIIERLQNNPLVLVSTIHEFLWNCIKPFQKQLKVELCKLNEIRYNKDLEDSIESDYLENLSERIESIDSVFYDDTAFRDFEKGQLHHDDVIILSKMMFSTNIVLTNILAQKYPYILVDEYQDTAEETIIALIDFLLERNRGKFILGFFGDSHQKIYESGIGNLEHYFIDENTKKIELVKKEENYRSSKEVVRLLNNFRTNIRQKEQTELEGSVKFVYCKYRPIKTRINRNGREVDDESRSQYNQEIESLKNENFTKVVSHLSENKQWVFDNSDNKLNDKILVLVNSAVAKRNGFPNLYRIYSRRFTRRVGDELNKRRNSLIQHFVGYIDKKTSQEREIGIEHLMIFWSESNYNEVIRFVKKYGSFFEGKYLEHKHKKILTDILNELVEIRNTKTVSEVLKFVEEKKLLNKSVNLKKFIEKINVNIEELEVDVDRERIIRNRTFFDSLMLLPYLEIINFFKHAQNNTVFSTKHGTKGEEYRNVLTVIDDKDWVNEAEGYNFEGFFDGTDESERRKLRTRNLFYVECSRARQNLVVLALSEMNENALTNVKSWFRDENVITIEKFIEE